MANNDPVPFASPYYPYKKVIASNTLKGAELIPYKILYYLLDLPDSNGYSPPDNNEYPRCRLAKYLWNDGPRPLDGPLPTPQEKLSMLFDPTNPDLSTDEELQNHPKGYRIFGQRNVAQSLIQAKTMLKIYVSRVFDDSDFRTIIQCNAEIWTDPNLETNTRTNQLERTFNIEQCLRESLAGVDVAAVGTIRFSRQAGSFNGSELLYSDSAVQGRLVYFSTSWSEGGGDIIKPY